MGELPLIRRFLAEVDVVANGCWLWRGKIDRDGYGLFVLAGRVQTAYVIAYEIWVGPRPEGLTLDHQCNTRSCVNPDHLKPMTMKENILRGNGWAAVNARKDSCLRGHPFDEGNTLILSTTGERICRTCKAMRQRRWQSREKVAV